jgi:hypothetical protein
MVATMSTPRERRAKALEEWADAVDADELVTTDTASLRLIAELSQAREELDRGIAESVKAARSAHRSWSEIGAMLGVSKQAAQRKYGTRASA